MPVEFVPFSSVGGLRKARENRPNVAALAAVGAVAVNLKLKQKRRVCSTALCFS